MAESDDQEDGDGDESQGDNDECCRERFYDPWIDTRWSS
jgi:hypothetical protein